MTLTKPTEKFVENILNEYSKIQGDELNEKLQKLFDVFNDEKNKFDVLIKVAALNKIYSTAITNINPVAQQISQFAVQNDCEFNNVEDYLNLVDKISITKWTNEKNRKFERNNLSFASKYVHFLSKSEIPIYDSYIWIIIKGYLGQYKGKKISFSNPKNYAEFYSTFEKFKKEFNLHKYSNYQIDKFLWYYGWSLIKKIEKENSIELHKAKSELKNQIKKACR